jgi:sugar lactone lactonase YvrE
MARLVRSIASLLLLSACAASPSAPDAAAPSDDAARLDAPAIDAAPSDAADASEPDDRFPLTATFPEGGTFDVERDAFFVGSLGDGSVHRVDRATGAETVFFSETAPGTWWTLGMDVDAARHRLWVCAMDDQRETTSETPPYAGYVWVFDLVSGERVANVDLSSVGVRATCTDVAVASDGSAYVSDRESPNVYHVTETGPVELFVTDDLLDAAVVGENAAVVLPDQSALLVVLYLPSRLVRVDLTDRSVRDVEIDGTFSDLTPALSGADGMTLSGDRLLVAFTSQVVELSPTLGDWSAASSRSVDVPAGMTDVIHTPSGDYLLNGQAVRFALGSATDPFALVRFAGF